jgi:alanyl-tRNA synthetase
LGVVKFLSEGSVGAGVRRVEALVGADAYSFLAKEHILLSQITASLKARPEELMERIEGIVAKLRDAEKELEKVRSANLRQSLADAVISSDVSGISIKKVILPVGTSANDVRTVATEIKGQSGQAAVVVVAAAEADGKVALVVAASKAAQDKACTANAVFAAVASHVDARGGGKADMAQGGGSNVSGIATLMSSVDAAVAAIVA